MATLKVTDEKFEEQVLKNEKPVLVDFWACLLYTSPSPRDGTSSRMPSSA